MCNNDHALQICKSLLVLLPEKQIFKSCRNSFQAEGSVKGMLAAQKDDSIVTGSVVWFSDSSLGDLLYILLGILTGDW